MKKHNPDAAIVSVPDHLHSEICVNIINFKVHCLVVKPMALKAADGYKMIKALEQNNVLGLVEFHKRLMNPI